MPGFDGTGPKGNGQGGRGRGGCGRGGAMGGQGNMRRGAGASGGRGRGGMGQGIRPVSPLPETDREPLRAQTPARSEAELIQYDLDELKARQREIEQRLREMQSLDDKTE